MLYATKDKLYVRTANGFEEVNVTMTGGSLEVTKLGKVSNSRPIGATPMLPCELIAQKGLEEGDVYPKRAVKQPQEYVKTEVTARGRK